MSERFLSIYKAQPPGPASTSNPDGSIPDLKILAIKTLPESRGSDSYAFDHAKAFFASEAKTLADALFATLPGGTIDALLGELLDRKRSIFRVPATQPKHARHVALDFFSKVDVYSERDVDRLTDLIESERR